jgi:hypothetical protein
MAKKLHKTHKKGKSRQHHHSSPALSVPELRQSFDHIEKYLEDNAHLPTDKLVREFKKEWRMTFGTPIHDGAEEYVKHVVSELHSKKVKGGMAPVDYVTRPGLYTTAFDQFGHFQKYISSGFGVSVPEPARLEDPKIYGPGGAFPTSVPVDMGNNRVTRGGKAHMRKTRRKTKGGSSMVGVRFPSSVPPSAIRDMTDMWKGTSVGPSPVSTSNPYIKL